MGKILNGVAAATVFTLAGRMVLAASSVAAPVAVAPVAKAVPLSPQMQMVLDQDFTPALNTLKRERSDFVPVVNFIDANMFSIETNVASSDREGGTCHTIYVLNTDKGIVFFTPWSKSQTPVTGANALNELFTDLEMDMKSTATLNRPTHLQRSALCVAAR